MSQQQNQIFIYIFVCMHMHTIVLRFVFLFQLIFFKIVCILFINELTFFGETPHNAPLLDDVCTFYRRICYMTYQASILWCPQAPAAWCKGSLLFPCTSVRWSCPSCTSLYIYRPASLYHEVLSLRRFETIPVVLSYYLVICKKSTGLLNFSFAQQHATKRNTNKPLETRCKPMHLSRMPAWHKACIYIYMYIYICLILYMDQHNIYSYIGQKEQVQAQGIPWQSPRKKCTKSYKW